MNPESADVTGVKPADAPALSPVLKPGRWLTPKQQALSYPVTRFETVSILIPVFNEVRFIRELLARVEAVDFCGLQQQIILVDDGSTDGTREILHELAKSGRYTVMFHPYNQGKGAALRTAIAQATGELVVIQDADLEYDPSDYPALIQLLLEGKADVVYGTRMNGAKPVRAFNIWHYFGNRLLTLLTNVLYNTTLTDMETCYKAFRADVLAGVTLKSDRFDFEPEITAKVLKQGYRLFEMPIAYFGRDFSEGKKISWRDGIWAAWALIRYRFED